MEVGWEELRGLPTKSLRHAPGMFTLEVLCLGLPLHYCQRVLMDGKLHLEVEIMGTRYVDRTMHAYALLRIGREE